MHACMHAAAILASLPPLPLHCCCACLLACCYLLACLLTYLLTGVCMQELQEQWERARSEEQSRGTGAADVRRWTGIRNIIEARELLRTLFVAACGQRAQVCEGQMELAKLQEAADILRIKLDMALQQMAESKRKALDAEAAAAAVISTPGGAAAAAGTTTTVAAGSSSDGEGAGAAAPGSGTGGGRRRPRARGILAHDSLGRSAAAAAAAAIAAAAAAAHDDVDADGVDALFMGALGAVGGMSGTTATASRRGVAASSCDARDDVDIEADALLLSMGLPPIAEEVFGVSPGTQSKGSSRPTPSCLDITAAPVQADVGSGADANTGATATQQQQQQPGDGDIINSSSTATTGTALRRGASERLSSGHGSAAAAAQAAALAAKLDALEVDWQGYKRSAAGANTLRRSGTGSGWRGGGSNARASYGSVPGSPSAASQSGGNGSFALGRGRPGSALRDAPHVHVDGAGGASSHPAGRRPSLSACSSPISGAAGAWASRRIAADGAEPDDCAAGGGSSNSAAAAATAVAAADIAKALDFLNVDDVAAAITPAADGSLTQQDKARRAASLPQQQQQHVRAGRRAAGAHATSAAAAGFHGDDSSSESGDDGDGDDEACDPSYDPDVHATPAGAARPPPRRSARAAARRTGGGHQEGPSKDRGAGHAPGACLACRCLICLAHYSLYWRLATTCAASYKLLQQLAEIASQQQQRLAVRTHVCMHACTNTPPPPIGLVACIPPSPFTTPLHANMQMRQRSRLAVLHLCASLVVGAVAAVAAPVAARVGEEPTAARAAAAAPLRECQQQQQQQPQQVLLLHLAHPVVVEAAWRQPLQQPPHPHCVHRHHSITSVASTGSAQCWMTLTRGVLGRACHLWRS